MPRTLTRRWTRIAALAAGAVLASATMAVLPIAAAHASVPGATSATSQSASIAQASTAEITQIASQRFEIAPRGMVVIEWSTGQSEFQRIRGGWVETSNGFGSGELIVVDSTGQQHTHQIVDHYQDRGGLGLGIDVKGSGTHPGVVHFSTYSAGSPLIYGPDGAYEGELTDWLGVNEMGVYGLTFL